ncbi:MAG: signal peptidase I [Candidatus Cloacimonadota bacterium]|nr:signal peptidase I [Candidatus Cloacimonadota bacterium]
MFGKKKNKKVKRKKNSLQGWLEALLFALVVVMPIKNYTFQNFKIPSSSMEKTLLIGDYLIANKWKYFFSDPERGDIVTFKNPADPDYPQPEEKYLRIVGPIFFDKENWGLKWQGKKNVVKRVIGMPGDTLVVKNKKVYINGELLKEDYVQYLDKAKILKTDDIIWNYNLPKFRGSDVNFGQSEGVVGDRDNFGPVVVPTGAYFVMGDNRDMSLDSRYWGFLNREFITGSPSLIVFSHGEKPVNSVREYIIKERNNLHNKASIRWERTFKLIN